MKTFIHAVDTISEYAGKVAGFLLVPLVLVVLIEVIARYGFNRPTIWGHELAIYLFGAAGILAVSYTLLHGGHIRMDIVYSRLSPRGQAAVDSIMFTILFFLYLGVLMWSTASFVTTSIRINEHTMSPWGPPVYPMKMVLFVAVVLVFLQGLSKFFRDLSYALRGRPLE